MMNETTVLATGTELEEATALVERKDAGPPESVLEVYRRMAPTQMDTHSLNFLCEYDPQAGMAKWEQIKQAAREELANGGRATDAALTSGATPFDRARFLALRESLAEEWSPRGGIEWTLIEQMATAQTHSWYWSRLLTDRASGGEVSSVVDLNEMANRMSEWEQRRCRWIAPRLTEAEALREAADMVDRWNRMYLRVLRQLRDLRRYNPPVVINNADKQVNIVYTNAGSGF